jgi:hypothetical protein
MAIALVDESAFVSDESGQLHRCKNLREALELSGWVYIGRDTRGTDVRPRGIAPARDCGEVAHQPRRLFSFQFGHVLAQAMARL